MKQLCLILLATTAVAGAAFTDELYRLLAEDNPRRNIIASPISVEIILSMIYLGARGNTSDQLQRTLKLPSDKEKVPSIYRRLLAIIEEHGQAITLDLANRVYVSNLYTINATYNKRVEDSFKAKAELIDFNNQEEAAAEINSFVTEQTDGEVRDCIAPSHIRSDEKVILVNAIYFKGQWKIAFDETEKMDFHLPSGNTTCVEMMSTIDYFRMKKFDFGQVLELPFANSSLSMFIFLPKSYSKLAAIEEKIPNFSETLPEGVVSVLLPKFKIDFREHLYNPLKRLGIWDLFTDAADLTDLLGQPGTKVEKVLHHAALEIDEKGAEASAARARSSFVPIESFTADRAFAFVIRDKSVIYLQGRFVNPENQC